MVNKMYSESRPIVLNTTYLKSFPCVLKFVQFICNAVIICIVATNRFYRDEQIQTAYLIASIGTLVFSGIIFLIKTHNVEKYINYIPWTKLEISYYIVWTVNYFIVIAQAYFYVQYKVAQMFALIALITFVVDACECYTKIKNEKCSCDLNFNKEKNEDFKDMKTIIV